MKLLLFTLLIISCSFKCYSQEVPKKLMKGIECSNDEFTGITKYYSKNCPLSISDSANHVKLHLSLACSRFDSPNEIKKIYIISGDQRLIIDDIQKFNNTETPTRRMSKASSGNFGTSSYRAAQFETRVEYVSKFSDLANGYMDIINSIVDNKGGKVKFECTNQDLTLDFNSKDANKMGAILKLYNHLIMQK